MGNTVNCKYDEYCKFGIPIHTNDYIYPEPDTFVNISYTLFTESLSYLNFDCSEPISNKL